MDNDINKWPAIFYIASKATHGTDWVRMRNKGYPIISSWINESGVGETSDWPDLWTRCVEEVKNASALVVIRREKNEVLKGARVEIRVALAAGVPVYAVGCEDFSVRHHPLMILCASEEEAFEQALLCM